METELARDTQRLPSPVTLSVRMDAGMAREIEAFRRKCGPIPPSTGAAMRLLLTIGLKAARAEEAAQ